MIHLIQPIETQYAGRRFRSRLEARWARFLDALRVRWSYEEEGFPLNSGWYLPDFVIRGVGGAARPASAMWLEVKPDDAGIVTDPRWEELAVVSNMPVAVVFGMPRPDQGEIGVVYGAAREGGHIEVYHCDSSREVGHAFAICNVCGQVGITHEGRRSEVCDHERESDRGAADETILAAYAAALSERFERGGVSP